MLVSMRTIFYSYAVFRCFSRRLIQWIRSIHSNRILISQAVFVLLSQCIFILFSSSFRFFCFAVDFSSSSFGLTRILHKFWFKNMDLGNCSTLDWGHMSCVAAQDTTSTCCSFECFTFIGRANHSLACLCVCKKKKETNSETNADRRIWNMNGDPFMSSFHSR